MKDSLEIYGQKVYGLVEGNCQSTIQDKESAVQLWTSYLSLKGEHSENQSLLHASHLQTPEDRAVLSGILSMSRSTFSCSVLVEIYSPAEKLVPTVDFAGEFNHFLYSVQPSHAKNYILTEKHVICQSCQDNGNLSEIPWDATKNTDLRSWPGNKASWIGYSPSHSWEP